jgi:hypothetical protein
MSTEEEKKMIYDFESKSLSTKSSIRRGSIDKNNYTTEEDEQQKEELNNPEQLKDLIVQLSNKIELLKEKNNNLINSLFEKEKMVQEIMKNSILNEDTYKNQVEDLQRKVNDLNDYIKQHEIEVYSHHLRLEEKNTLKRSLSLLKKAKKKSSLFFKYNERSSILEADLSSYGYFDEDEDKEIRELTKQLENKEEEILLLKSEWENKLKFSEDKYLKHIDELNLEINRLQDALNSNNVKDTIYRSQLSDLDESKENLEKEIVNLNKEINMHKGNKFLLENEYQKLKEINDTLYKTIEDNMKVIGEYEEISNKHNRFMKDYNNLKILIANKDIMIEKLTNHVTKLQKEGLQKDIDKNSLLNELRDQKEEYFKMGIILKENNSKLQEEFKIQKIKMNRLYESEKSDMIGEMEKMKNVIENLKATISNLKSVINRNSLLKDSEQYMNKTFNIMKYRTTNDVQFNSHYDNQFVTPEENLLTLQDCLSEGNSDEEKILSKEEKKLQNKLDEKEKEISNLISKNKLYESDIETLMNQNIELKSILANERFEKDTINNNFRIKFTKLREHIQKQEMALALKTLNSL